jgi:hypothetical protein
MNALSIGVPADLDAGEAEYLEVLAAHKREVAAQARGADPLWIAQQRAEAAGLDALAAALRDPEARGVPALRSGRGGEAAPPDDADLPGRTREVAQAVAARPGMLAADASLARLALARDAGALALAVETAEDVGAETAAEKMLAHQLAAGHALAMRLLASADGDLTRHVTGRAMNLNPNAHVEATRSALAAARLMDACSRSALAFDRLRHGGRQVVTVQHVTVADGGRAVVAGSVAPAPPEK